MRRGRPKELSFCAPISRNQSKLEPGWQGRMTKERWAFRTHLPHYPSWKIDNLSPLSQLFKNLFTCLLSCRENIFSYQSIATKPKPFNMSNMAKILDGYDSGSSCVGDSSSNDDSSMCDSSASAVSSLGGSSVFSTESKAVAISPGEVDGGPWKAVTMIMVLVIAAGACVSTYVYFHQQEEADFESAVSISELKEEWLYHACKISLTFFGRFCSCSTSLLWLPTISQM